MGDYNTGQSANASAVASSHRRAILVPLVLTSCVTIIAIITAVIATVSIFARVIQFAVAPPSTAEELRGQRHAAFGTLRQVEF